MEKIIFNIFIFFLITKMLMQFFLEWLNWKSLKSHNHTFNPAINGIMDEATLAKMLAYSKWKIIFSLIKISFSTVMLYWIISTGVIKSYFNFLSVFLENSFLVSSIFILSFMLGYSLLFIPFNFFYTFVLEQKFGFNKSTMIIFLTDLSKSIFLTLILFLPVLYLIFWGINYFPENWWLFSWITLVIFQLIFQFIFPKFILPLFNRLTPLPDGELKQEIHQLANKLQFNTKEILIMDGSKRSKHSNAFFTGFGRGRRVVFFDTLIQQLKKNEIKAILAHEIGHYKKKHILKGIILSFSLTLIGFKFLHLMTSSSDFSLSFHLSVGNVAQTFLVFLLISELITFWGTPFFNFFSRKNEYEADAYAKKKLGEGNSLINGLKQLYLENLANLNPHPLYSFFYYSHPTFFERKKKLTS